MSSSFRRAAKSDSGSATRTSSSYRGTKPWTGGVTLTSSGLRELDGILGGGQPLQTAVLVEQDRWTHDLADCLCRYWCAEALSQGQALLIPVEQDDEAQLLPRSPPSFDTCLDDSDCVEPRNVQTLLDTLPRNLHWDKHQQSEKAASSGGGSGQTSSASMTTLEEDDGEEHEVNEKEEGLEIAWQYRSSIQRERLGLHRSGLSNKKSASQKTKEDSIYCHSYDLSGKLQNDKNHLVQRIQVTSLCRSSTTRKGAFLLFRKLTDTLEQKIKEDPGVVVRLFLWNLPVTSIAIALPLLLAYIRENSLPVVVFTFIPAWKWKREAASLVCLRRASDVVLKCEGFAGRAHYPPPPEFSNLQGILQISKVSSLGLGHFCDAKRPPANQYGLKRDRRKLHIQLLHIPPEDYAKAGGSVGGGGVRSGAGRPVDSSHLSAAAGAAASSCGTGSSALDF